MSELEQTQTVERPEGKNTEKTYGYTYDSNHEASIEARLIHIIEEIGQTQGSHIAGSLEGRCHSLIAEIQGFMHKWQTFESYVEKAEGLISSQKTVDLHVMKCLYRDFMTNADRLGFKNATNVQEEWEKRFLGLSKSRRTSGASASTQASRPTTRKPSS